MIDDNMILKLEKLSMIKISDEHKEALKEEMNEILLKMQCLKDINTDDIKLDSSNLKTPLREDKATDSNIINDVLSIAPNAKDGFFIVPKII